MTERVRSTIERQYHASPRDICQESQSNFIRAFFFLSRDQRRALEAVYAFARVLDDAVDEWKDPAEQTLALSFWRDRFDETALSPTNGKLLSELNWAIRYFQIPREPFYDLIRGCGRDIQTHQYQTFAELEAYCYDVASTVGLMTLPIFGIMDPKAKESSIALGKALQMTNIIRDVYEDACRGRIYIPIEDFNRFGYAPENLQKKRYNDDFFALMSYEAVRAETFFREASGFLSRLDRAYLAPWLMAETYYAILQLLKRRQFNVFEGRLGLSGPRKMALFIRTWWRSKRSV